MKTELTKQLEDVAIKYLWNKNYRICKKEKTAGYYGIYDAWGINYVTHYTMGIEVKISRADFKKSHKAKNLKLQRGVSDELQRIQNNFSRAGYDYISTLQWGGAEENYYVCPKGLI